MIADFSIIPLGGDSHISSEVAEALKIVDASGLPYRLTPVGTCVEGEWEEVMTVVKLCHERVREISPHVITMIKIEDERGAEDKLTRNVASVKREGGPSAAPGEPDSHDHRFALSQALRGGTCLTRQVRLSGSGSS